MRLNTISVFLLFVLALVLAPVRGQAQFVWKPDTVLNDGYECAYVNQPDDYSGKVRSTIIRRLSWSKSNKGVLYIHGFNDYFFQYEMGEEFNSHSYEFFAVDLRKYGRSLLPGQKPFEMRSVSEYYADIDSALSAMRYEGINDIVLMGHSTGGLIASCYLSALDRDNPEAAGRIKALVLNSPFLDWNLGTMECFVQAVAFFGKLAPGIKVKQGGSAYSESLLKSHHGEWVYNTEWKKFNSSDVDLGWVRAIDRAQRSLRGGKSGITQPILLLFSDKSVSGEWDESHNRADGVLDVNDINKYGRMLGPNVTVMRVRGGLHDLLLSAPVVRSAVYTAIFDWLKRVKI